MATPPGSPGSFTLQSDQILDFATDISKNMLRVIARRVAADATNTHPEKHDDDEKDLTKLQHDQKNAFIDKYSEWILPVACSGAALFLNKNKDKRVVVEDSKEPAAAMQTNESKSVERGGINTSSDAYKLLQETVEGIASETIEKAADLHMIQMHAALFPFENRMSEKVKKFYAIQKPRFVNMLKDEAKEMAIKRLKEASDRHTELRGAKRVAEDAHGGAEKKVKKECD